MKKNILTIGCRVALSVDFLHNTGQRTGLAGFRRGTVVALDPIFARVRWDDTTEATYKALADQWGEDFADDVRANGSQVNRANLALVGSAAMSTN